MQQQHPAAAADMNNKSTRQCVTAVSGVDDTWMYIIIQQHLDIRAA